MSSRVTQLHRTRLGQISAEAEALEGAARRIKQMAEEVLAKGGQLHAQGQMTFIVGSIARLLKDTGVIEQLQADGVAQRHQPQ